MKNLLEQIDNAFGRPPRSPQVPTDASQERERVFAERAKKIEALREMRLANPRKEPPPLTFEIVRHGGHWRILHAGRHSPSLPNQAEAIQAAREAARAKRKLGHPVEVILRRTNGDSVEQSIDDGSRKTRPR